MILLNIFFLLTVFHHGMSQELDATNPHRETSSQSEPRGDAYSSDGQIVYTGFKHKHPGFTSGKNHLETLSWAVHIKPKSFTFPLAADTDLKASQIASELGLRSKGQIGHLENLYLFVYETSLLRDHLSFGENGDLKLIRGLVSENSDSATGVELDHLRRKLRDVIHGRLDGHERIEWYTQQTTRKRAKRTFLEFNDPMYSKQWHLHNEEPMEYGMDINVTGVWERNITGKGVVAVVVDDGLEWTVPDILPNYKPGGSWDLNSNDANPLPATNDKSNHHGTRCAGEIAAAKNNFCAVGVAYEAGIAGIRVLDGPMTDSLEATAFTKNFDVNDVYSCSWGPDDDGKTVDGPHHLANLALRHGVDFGRQGYGTIYVVASGNGGLDSDNCNYDGYANSIFTMTIGAVDESGAMPYYAEECASMLAVTFSSGTSNRRYIVTSDWQHKGGTGCTDQHSGTSAAAPLAAGMVALALQARPCLTWRDIQYIIVVSALKVDIDIAHWQKNAAGLHHSHKHGFGLMNGWRIVNAAKIWEPVPWMTVFTSELMELDDTIYGASSNTHKYSVLADQLDGYNLYSLEYVQVTVTIAHSHRGHLEILLTCPSGTKSVLGATRPHDDSTDGFVAWTFSTVRCWAEKPEGVYLLTINDKGKSRSAQGQFISWQLKLYGSPMTFEEVQDRMRMVKKSYSGEFLNDSYSTPCPPPPDKLVVGAPLSERMLKILVLTGSFAFFMAVYESIEYVFCYDEEKKEYTKLSGLLRRAQTLIRNRSRTPRSTGTGDENRGLLGSNNPEMIQMTELLNAPSYNANDQSSPDFGEGACGGHNAEPNGMYARIPEHDPSQRSTQAQQTSSFQVHESSSSRSHSKSAKQHNRHASNYNTADVIAAPFDFQNGDTTALEFDDFVSSGDFVSKTS